MKIAQNTSGTIASASRHSEARSFAHHYGGIRRTASPERTLRVYPPLSWGIGWGVGQVMPHVRRASSVSESRHDGVHSMRMPLSL